MLCSVNWVNFIVWLSLLLEILGNIYIVVICFPAEDAINFEVNLSFLIKLLEFNILRMKRAFSCQKLSQTQEWVFKLIVLVNLTVSLIDIRNKEMKCFYMANSFFKRNNIHYLIFCSTVSSSVESSHLYQHSLFFVRLIQ